MIMYGLYHRTTDLVTDKVAVSCQTFDPSFHNQYYDCSGFDTKIQGFYIDIFFKGKLLKDTHGSLDTSKPSDYHRQ